MWLFEINQKVYKIIDLLKLLKKSYYMETIFCQNCKCTFNDGRRPFLLPCGHNLCEACLGKSLYADKRFFCPFDKTFLKLENCKLNFRLLRIAKQPVKKYYKLKNHKTRGLNNNKSLSPILDCKRVCQSRNLSRTPDSVSSLKRSYVNKTPTKYSPIEHKKFLSVSQSVDKISYIERSKTRILTRKIKKNIDSHSSIQNIIILTATLVGGMYIYNKFKPVSNSNKGAVKGSFLSLLKESSSSIVSKLFYKQR